MFSHRSPSCCGYVVCCTIRCTISCFLISLAALLNYLHVYYSLSLWYWKKSPYHICLSWMNFVIYCWYKNKHRRKKRRKIKCNTIGYTWHNILYWITFWHQHFRDVTMTNWKPTISRRYYEVNHKLYDFSLIYYVFLQYHFARDNIVKLQTVANVAYVISHLYLLYHRFNHKYITILDTFI